MPVQWISYKGKRILYSDYRGLSEQEMLENLKQEDLFYSKEKMKFLSLNDYRETYLNKEFMHEVTELGKKYKDMNLKSAILGISGFKKILLNGYSRLTGHPLRSFDDEESAKEYLVKEQ